MDRLAQNCNVTDFYEIWHSEQIEHGNLLNLIPKLKCTPIFMKFGNWCKLNMLFMNIVLGYWWSPTKIIDVGKFGPNTKICSDFFLLSINSIKDTHKEKAPSNKTPVLRKSTNMGVWAVGTLSQFFIRGSYTETKLSKK